MRRASVLRSSAPFTLGALVLALLAACGSSTRFVSTWTKPDVPTVRLAGQKVAVFVIHPRDSVRRTAEDQMAREISARGARGVAGYSLMSSDDARDESVAAEKLKAAGVDAVVTLQLLGRQEESYYQPGTAWVQPTYYRSWRGYWRRGWSTVYTPGYLQTQTVVSAETMVYQVSSGDLLWAGRSETTEPSRIDSFIDELASALDKELVKAGVLE